MLSIQGNSTLEILTIPENLEIDFGPRNGVCGSLMGEMGRKDMVGLYKH